MENPSWQIWARAVSRTALTKGYLGLVTWDFLQPQLMQPEPRPRDCVMDRVSQHVLSGYLPPQWNNSTGESVTARGDLIWFSCVRDGGRQTVLRRHSFVILHWFSKWSHFAAVANPRILEGDLFAGGERWLTVVPKGSDTYRSAGVCTCCQRIVLVPWRGRAVRG